MIPLTFLFELAEKVLVPGSNPKVGIAVSLRWLKAKEKTKEMKIETNTVMPNGSINKVGEIVEDNTFVNKELDRYIEKIGSEEEAIFNLSKLSKKSTHAKKMLDLLMKRNQPEPKAEPQPVRKIGRVRKDPIIRKDKLEPKQIYLNMVNGLGVSVDDVKVEVQKTEDGKEIWIPRIAVTWRWGRAFIKNKTVIYPREFNQFMEQNILFKKEVCFDMRVIKIQRGRVIAEPISENYFSREKKMMEERKAEQERIRNERIFEGRAVLKGNFIRIEPTAVKNTKKIIIPKDHLAKIASNLGTWSFDPVKEYEDRIIAIPLEKVFDRSTIKNKSKTPEEVTAEKCAIESKLLELKSNGKIEL